MTHNAFFFLFSFSKWLYRVSFIFVFDSFSIMRGWSKTSYRKQEGNYTLSPSRPQVPFSTFKAYSELWAPWKSNSIIAVLFYSLKLFCNNNGHLSIFRLTCTCAFQTFCFWIQFHESCFKFLIQVLSVRVITISGYSMTSSIMASGVDTAETYLLVLFEL